MTAADRSEDITGQTRQVLDKIDSYLEKADVDKSHVLTAQIWLKHIERDFKAMNEAWNAWTVPGHAPSRATVEASMAAPDILIEIVVTAACAD
ncbi:RidA family protein [Tropicimonas sp. IMCC34011]|uniref:RidA family protein n=1 Tax=Tropicimonas sp. IMCC34011 TaxID=2248759 RepID=UPI000E25540A|nr:RidA family protein [Tropicimonas sp. IMCC34011]